MGRFVAGDAPAMDRLVEESIAKIGAEIESMRIPGLWGVVLGGGYGRGEGGVLVDGSGRESLSNDLDFFAVTEPGASGATIRAMSHTLDSMAVKWTDRLVLDVDFTVRTPWRIRHDQERLMIQELLHSHVDVAGAKGETLFRDVERRPPEALPIMEAVRLLVNRGTGLAFAQRNIGTLFGERNINKCILGAGDARLIARHSYAWRLAARADALGDSLYAQAAEWKQRPRRAAPCDWETARKVWLDALEEVSGAVKPSRNLFNALRWIVRRRTVGELRTFGQDPLLRIIRRLKRTVEKRDAISGPLLKDWQTFN